MVLLLRVTDVGNGPSGATVQSHKKGDGSCFKTGEIYLFIYLFGRRHTPECFTYTTAIGSLVDGNRVGLGEPHGHPQVAAEPSNEAPGQCAAQAR